MLLHMQQELRDLKQDALQSKVRQASALRPQRRERQEAKGMGRPRASLTSLARSANARTSGVEGLAGRRKAVRALIVGASDISSLSFAARSAITR